MNVGKETKMANKNQNKKQKQINKKQQQQQQQQQLQQKLSKDQNENVTKNSKSAATAVAGKHARNVTNASNNCINGSNNISNNNNNCSGNHVINDNNNINITQKLREYYGQQQQQQQQQQKQYNKLAATNALQECAANAPKFERSGSFSIRGRLSKLISSITNSKESLNANEKEHELPFQFTRSRSLILPKRTSRRSLVEPQLEQLSEEVEKWSDLTLPASPRKNSMESTDSKAEETCISAAIVSPPIEIPRNSQQSLTSTPCLKSPNSISFDPHQNFKRLRSNTFISSFKSTFAGLTGEKKKEKLNPKWSASLQSLQAIDNMVSYENMSFIDYDKFNGYEKHLERQLSQISLMEANQDMQMPRPSDCNVITEDTSCTLLNAAVTPVCSTTSAVFVAPQTVIRRRQRISSHNTSSRALADRHSASRHSFHLDTDYEHNLDKPRNVYRDSLDSRKLEILNSLSRSSFILDSNIIDVLDLADGSLGKRKRGAYQTNKRREPGGVDVVDARQSKQLKSKSLTHLDGLGTETVCNHAKNNANVSSSEYFSVSFCMESGFQEEEFFPATKGVTLANALNQAIKRRNLSFSQLNITDINDDNSTQHLLDAKYKPLQRSLDENTEVEQLAGHHLMITDKEGSRKTLQKAASFGSRSRPPRLLSSASTDESSDVNLSGKQLKQRWSGLFGVKNPQQSQLCELLNNYSKTGVPQKTIPTYDFEHPDLEAAVAYLDNIHKSWRDIVQSDRMSDSEMRIQTAIWELVTTEVDYIHCLQTVTDLFLACLEAVQDEGLLQDVDQYRLFANIREICEANLKFWTFYLYPMVAHSIAMNEPLRVGFFQSGFIQFANIFSPYKKYCAEQSSCQFYCKELNRNNSVFTSYLAWCEAQKMCNRLRLADILVRPMQRLTKYSLLLAAIRKHMSEVEEIEAIDAMVQNTENFVFSVNNHLTTRQENERLKGVMARIESYDVVDTNNEHLDKLIKQYSQMFDLCGPMKGCASQHVRHLFMEGDHKYKDNHGKADVHCFLLTDMLLVCKSIAKKGLGSLKVIRQPYLTDRLVVQHTNNILSCVYLNEFQVAITAFTLQCTEAKSWYESLKRAKMVYARLKQCSTSNWESNLRYTGSIISAAGTIDSLGVKKSPLNSSICSHVTSANNSHSGSVEWNDSRNVSVDFEKTNSLSSDEGCSYLGAHGFPVKAKPVTTISPQKLKINTVSIANTLAVQPLHHLGQSLPNLTLHHSQANNTLLVPGTTSSHSGNVLLSPSHRGISYPPPNPSRVPLRRGMAFSSSIKNPPLLKTRNITSQNSINWHQIPATPTPTSPTTHQLPQQPANQNSFPKTIEAENINIISPSILSNSLAYNFNNPSDTTQSEINNASRINNLPPLNSNQTFTTQLSNTETDV